MLQLANEDLRLQTQDRFLRQQKALLVHKAQEAEKGVLHDAALLQAEAAAPPPDPSQDPVSEEKRLLSSWLIMSAPQPAALGSGPKKKHLSYVERALRKVCVSLSTSGHQGAPQDDCMQARLEARILGKEDAGAMSNVILGLQKLAANTPAAPQDCVFERKKAREAAKLAVSAQAAPM